MAQSVENYSEKHEKYLERAVSQGMEYCELTGAIKLFLGCGIAQVREMDEIYEPHLSFFPWASKRQIFLAIHALIKFLTKTKHMLVQCREKYAVCYDRWVKHGVGRKVGIIQGLSYGDLHLYQVNHADI